MPKFGYGGGSWDGVDVDRFEQLHHGMQAISRRHGKPGVIFVPDFKEPVHRGMDLLDEVAPGWSTTIDLGDLDLLDEHRCVLGQAWPHYQRLRGLAERARSFTASEFSILPPRVSMDEPANEFEQMLSQLGGDTEMECLIFAGSVGCNLRAADFEFANIQAKQLVIDAIGACAHTTTGHQEMCAQASLIIHQMYEHLTETWLREIHAARGAGRWPDGNQLLDLSHADALVQPNRELLKI